MPSSSNKIISTSNIRNPILVSSVDKGLLPYHGLGSGIKRALTLWPQIDFTDDREGCLFVATVHRNAPINAPLTSLQAQLLDLVKADPNVSYDQLAALTLKDRSTVMRNMAKLKLAGKVQRVGAKKSGYWTVIELNQPLAPVQYA